MALTFALVRNVGYVATMGRAERGEGLVTRGGGGCCWRAAGGWSTCIL